MREMLLLAMRGARDIVHRQQVTMNNLANVSTDGFRREISLVQEGQDTLMRRATGPDLTGFWPNARVR